jgi:3-hydroxybutyryl-CoA dehydratase
MLTHLGGMLGFLATEMQFEFVGAVYVGDTVTCNLTFVERDEQRRRFSAESSSVNQDGVEVLRGRVSGFPSQIRLR